MRNINKINTESEYLSKEFISPSLNKVVETDMLHWDSTSDRLTSGADEKVFAIELYEIVDSLPGTPEYNKIYLIEDPDSGSYKQYGWINDEWVYYGTNEGAIPPVSSLTQAEYDALVSASAVSQNVLYNITDSESLNTDTYQKKLVAGDFIHIDSTTNTIDCTLDQNLYIIVDTLPPVGIENKIYLVKRTLGDGTVVFVQYAWNVNGDDTFTEYGNTGTVSVKGGSGVSVSSDAVVDASIETPLKFNPATSAVTVSTGRGVQISNNSIEAKPGGGLKFDGTSAMTVNVSSGINITNSALTASIGTGLKFDNSGKILVNYTTPLSANASSQLTVLTSSAYTSTGIELFTRAGAYSMYSSFGKEVTISYSANTDVVNSVRSYKAFKILPNLDLYYLTMYISVKALSSQVEVSLFSSLAVDGHVPGLRQSLAAAGQNATTSCGIIWKNEGGLRTVFIQPTRAIPNNDNIVMTGFVYLPNKV